MATEDEAQLKQRARWRLIGAVALALVAFVVLPLLFDPAPKPLGSDVEISIAMAPQPLPPSDPAAEPSTAPLAAPEAAPLPTQPAPPVLVAPTQSRASRAESREEIRAPVSSSHKLPPAPQPVSKPEPQPEPVEEGKLLGESGYYLQLGVFSKADNARALAEKVRALGYKVTITPVGSLHRVRVVGFNSGEKDGERGREQALAAKQALKQKGISADLHGS